MGKQLQENTFEASANDATTFEAVEVLVAHVRHLTPQRIAEMQRKLWSEVSIHPVTGDELLKVGRMRLGSTGPGL